MKPVGRFSKLIPYAAVLLGGMLAFTSDAAMLVNKAVVRGARGTTSFKAGSQGYATVKVGMIFSPHTVIKTGPNSSVDLFLNENGPVVRVTENSELSLDKLDIEKGGVEDIIETQLDLRSGRVLGNVKKMAAASKYEVKTPHGVAGIRGTEYDIRADGTVYCISGTIVVVYIDARNPSAPAATVTLNAGQSASPPVSPNTPVVVGATPANVVTEAHDVTTVTITYQTTPPPPPPPGSPNQSSAPGGGPGGTPQVTITGNVPTPPPPNTVDLTKNVVTETGQ